MPSTLLSDNGVLSGSAGIKTTGSNDGSLALQTTTPSGVATTAVTVDTAQNVGIGTGSPISKLDVAGFVRLGNYGGAFQGVTLQNNNNSASAETVNFIDTQNNVGIPDTNIFARHQTDGGSTLEFATTPPGSRTVDRRAERMRIDSSGALILAGSTAQKATGTTWSNPSDVRLKDNIRDYAKGMAELMQVRVCEWEYNGKGGTVAGTKGMGVIADEAMLVLPDTVDTYEAKLNVDDEEVTAIKKFDATEITWLLVKGLQELKAEFDAYKAAHP